MVGQPGCTVMTRLLERFQTDRSRRFPQSSGRSRPRPVESATADVAEVRPEVRFQKLPPEQISLAFFNLWTRKEAWLKATGEGIGYLLNVVEVSFIPGEPAQFISLPGNAQTTEPWVIHNLDPAPGFAAALAVHAQVTPEHCCCWGEEATGKLVET